MGPVTKSFQNGQRSYLHPAIALLTTGLLVLVIPLAGCAKRSSVHAESREIRLTEGGGTCFRPIFSPDGTSIAYTFREPGDPPLFSIRLVSPEGGPARIIHSDSLAAVAVSWAPDGEHLFVLGDKSDSHLSLMTLDGKLLKKFSRPPVARFIAVSPDGDEVLYSIFGKDNWEMALQKLGDEGEPRLLAETPAWESGGCFGPKPGDVTVVSRSVYGAPTNEFFIWSPDKAEFKPLPLPKARNDMPSWSRDGKYLAYSTNLAGATSLWVLDMDGGRSVEITSGPEDDTRPDWSPDGESLVFLRGKKFSHIYAADPETREKRQLTSGDVVDSEPMVSPDGKRIAFIRERSGMGVSGGATLAWVDVGGGPVQEIDLRGLIFNAYGGVSWSPDGRELAFAADDGSGNVDIYRVPAEGGPPARVTVTPGTDVIPIWSPDGRTIGYTRAGGGETLVWTIPSSGGVPTKASFEEGVNQLTFFSPDSKRIAYMTVRLDGAYDLKVNRVGSGERGTTILHSKVGIYPFAWSEEGRYVMAWEMAGDHSGILAVAADGGEKLDVGEAIDEPDGKGYFIHFTPRGKAFANVVYPGGIHAFQYGDNRTDVYVAHVADLLAAESAGAQAGARR